MLGALDIIRGNLSHLQIALLVDWSHTIKPASMPDFLARVADSAADGLLVHGLPPRLRSGYYAAARELQLPIITTCYARSSVPVHIEAAASATAYLYLVAQYGRSGIRPVAGFNELTPVVSTLRGRATAPIAVGFGYGTAVIFRPSPEPAPMRPSSRVPVERIEHALTNNTDPVENHKFVGTLKSETGNLSKKGR